MAELRSLFSSLGFEDVVTYVQSGNVVFRSATDDADEVSARIEVAIAEAFDAGPAVLLRTPAELQAIATSHPYLSREANVSKLHVVFLDHAPAPAAVGEFDPERSPGDDFTVAGRQIYLHLPNGAGRSKLTIDYFERALGVRATQRNWNTLVRLRDLSSG